MAPIRAGYERVRIRGARRAFDAWFARALPRLRRFVGLRLGAGLRGKVEVGDVVQETCVEAWQRLEGFEARGEGSFLRWFFALAAIVLSALVALAALLLSPGSARAVRWAAASVRARAARAELGMDLGPPGEQLPAAADRE